MADLGDLTGMSEDDLLALATQRALNRNQNRTLQAQGLSQLLEAGQDSGLVGSIGAGLAALIKGGDSYKAVTDAQNNSFNRAKALSSMISDPKSSGTEDLLKVAKIKEIMNKPSIESAKLDQREKELQARKEAFEARAEAKKLAEEQRAEARQAREEQKIAMREPKDAQLSAAGYATRMELANNKLDQLYQNYDPTGVVATAERNLPKFLEGVRSENAKLEKQAKRDFISAVLRKESGAAISQGEFDQGEAQYFPQAGDSPAVLAQKAENRKTAIEAIKAAAGSGALERIQSGLGRSAPVAAPQGNESDKLKRLQELRAKHKR